MRWVDTLTAASKPSLLDAAYRVHSALEHGDEDGTRLQIAGAHIRGVRKRIEDSCGITSLRCRDESPNITDRQLIWMALSYLGAAGTWAGDHDFTLSNLRHAEAALRTIHHRAQAAGRG